MSIRLIILRHGHYVPGSGQALTADSCQRCQVRAEQLASEFGAVDMLYSSEISRAKATAGLIAQGMKYPAEKIVITENLSELSSMQQVTYFIHLLVAEAAVQEYQNIVIVTHLPVIEKFMQFFTGEQVFVAPECGIVFEADSWDSLLESSPRISVVN